MSLFNKITMNNIYEIILIIISFILIYYKYTNTLILIGVCFVISNRFKEKFFTCDIANWICLNIISPKFKYNHIIWGCASILLGISSKINSTSTSGEEIAMRDPCFFLLSALVIMFAIIVSIIEINSNNKQPPN